MKQNNNIDIKILRIIIFGLGLILISSWSFVYAQVPLMGDVNDDSLIDIVDALLVAQYYVGLFTGEQPPIFIIGNADVNESGAIDIVDALLIAQYYVGLIDDFKQISTPVPSVVPTPTPELTPVPTGTPDSIRVVPRNQPFTMTYGETVVTDIYNVYFTFSGITDSRCPAELICVWEGEVEVAMELNPNTIMYLKAPPAVPQSDSLSSPEFEFRLTCRGVEPYPVNQDPIPLEDYVVTLSYMIIVP